MERSGHVRLCVCCWQSLNLHTPHPLARTPPPNVWTLPVQEEVMDKGHKLKVVGRAGTGVDNINVPVATKRGILVCVCGASVGVRVCASLSVCGGEGGGGLA